MSPEEYVGYENLIRSIEDRQLQRLDGDIIEIGAYMGGGTVKLAGFARKYHKKVFAVDTFDPGVDRTVGRGGVTAGEVYEAFLDYYPITSYSLDDTLWVAWQFDLPERGEGMVQAFRRSDSIYESARLKLRGLDPTHSYSVTDLDSGKPRKYSGRELLERGLPIVIAEPPGAAVVTYVRTE